MTKEEDCLYKLEAILQTLEKDIGFFDPDCELGEGFFHSAIADDKERSKMYQDVRGGVLDLIVNLLEEME